MLKSLATVGTEPAVKVVTWYKQITSNNHLIASRNLSYLRMERDSISEMLFKILYF
jgi:hypothetical protein